MPTPEEFAAAGLFDPAEHRDTGRLDLLNWLVDQGFTVDEMVVGLASDSLGAMAGDRWLVSGDRLDHERAVAASGLEPDVFDALITAFGFQSIDPTDPSTVEITTEEMEAIATVGGLSTMFSPAEAISLVRVVGTSLSRVAEAAVSLFLTDVESPMLVHGESELELALKVRDAVGLLDGFMARLDPILRRHVLQAIHRSRQALIDPTERFQHRYAIGFVDLVGFTAMSERMTPQDLAGFLRDFEGRAHDAVTAVGARVVKLIGDEVMFVATDAAAACRAGEALMVGFGGELDRVVPRGGLAYGNVLVRGGDYYGSVVNLASRLVDEAVPQEMLVTEQVAAAAAGCCFEPAGRRMVKGFSDPVQVRTLISC